MTLRTEARTSTAFDVRPYLDGIGAVLAGPANVVMQLALPAVGHGVVESPVESGRLTDHPFKRARTTFTYLAVALLGDDMDRVRYRQAVNSSHRAVRSGPDSAVRYNAFDPRLQLWVAACLYYGTRDIHERMRGPLPAEDAEALLRHCARFGTTLQVPEGAWPTDLEAFESYWRGMLSDLDVDETVRRYLLDLAELRHVPWKPPGAARAQAWITAGFLPAEFRRMLGWSWSLADERRFAAVMRGIGLVSRALPGPVRRLPISGWLWDMRRRARRGAPLV